MDFWKEFINFEQIIVYNLKLGTKNSQLYALKGIETIGKKTGYDLLFQIGYDTRNGRNFPERKNTFELIISPNWNRNKIPMVEELYSAHKEFDIPEYWSIVKYQVFNPTFIYELNIKGITHEYFQYCSQININGSEIWLGLIVFIKDELAEKILIKDNPEEKNPEKISWKLKENCIKSKIPMIFLNSTVGEYNMIKRIKAVDFIPMSSHLTIPRYALSDLCMEFEKMDKHASPNDKILSCFRCEYNSYQVDIKSCTKCKKIYYCDNLCEIGDFETHKYICM